MSELQPTAPQWQPSAPAVVYDRRVGNTVEVWCSIILAVLSIGYFLPWLVAASRGKTNSAAIALVNLLLGWTFVGWVVALVMACTPHPIIGSGNPQQVVPAAPGWYPAQGGLAYWDGSRWTGHTA